MEIEYILSDFRGMFDFVAVTLSTLLSSLFTQLGALVPHLRDLYWLFASPLSHQRPY